MTPPKKKAGSGAGLSILGGAGSPTTTASGAGSMTLPNAATLEAAANAAGISLTPAQIKAIAGKKVPITVGTSGYPSGADLVSAVDGLSSLKGFGESASKVVAQAIGLNDPSLGTSVSSRANSITKYYPASGDLNTLNPSSMQPYSTPPKVLSTVGKTTNATIPPQAKTYIDGVLKRIGAPITANTEKGFTLWLENEQGGTGLPSFTQNQGNPLGIQTPQAQESGKRGDLQTAIALTAQELNTNYQGIVDAFKSDAAPEAIGQAIVNTAWNNGQANGTGYGGLASFMSGGANNPGAVTSQPAIQGSTPYEQYTSLANADNTLTNWGLDTPEMNKMVTNLVASGVTNTNQILQNIRQTQTYKQAFPGLSEYNAKPGQIHMTESEYRTYSQSLQNAAQQYGGVRLNQNQVATLLNGNVSPSEFQQRVQDIGVAVANADPGTKAILKQQFGIDPAHLFAYYANPKETLPDMQRAVASGEIQDYANRVGLAGLRPAGAAQLADMAKLSATQGNNPLGVGVSQVEGSLLNASRDSALTSAAPGANVPTINTNQLIGSQLAGFGGQSQVADQIAVGRAEGARAAPFDKGGGPEQTSKGVTGIGSAST